MKRTEAIYREILYRAAEKKEARLTQSELSKRLGISLSVVNLAVKKLESLGAIKIMQRSFRILDAKKILLFWASVRNLDRDIAFKVRVEASVREIERAMPNVMFTAYTAYKLRFNDVPSDYSEVYVYASEEEIEKIKLRFAKFKKSDSAPNLFVLKKDPALPLYERIPEAQIFVDLWNLKEWYAKEFVNALEKRMGV